MLECGLKMGELQNRGIIDHDRIAAEQELHPVLAQYLSRLEGGASQETEEGERRPPYAYGESSAVCMLDRPVKGLPGFENVRTDEGPTQQPIIELTSGSLTMASVQEMTITIKADTQSVEDSVVRLRNLPEHFEGSYVDIEERFGRVQTVILKNLRQKHRPLCE